MPRPIAGWPSRRNFALNTKGRNAKVEHRGYVIFDWTLLRSLALRAHVGSANRLSLFARRVLSLVWSCLQHFGARQYSCKCHPSLAHGIDSGCGNCSWTLGRFRGWRPAAPLTQFCDRRQRFSATEVKPSLLPLGFPCRCLSSGLMNPIGRLGGSGGVMSSRSASKTCLSRLREFRLNVPCVSASPSVFCSNSLSRLAAWPSRRGDKLAQPHQGAHHEFRSLDRARTVLDVVHLHRSVLNCVPRRRSARPIATGWPARMSLASHPPRLHASPRAA